MAKDFAYYKSLGFDDDVINSVLGAQKPDNSRTLGGTVKDLGITGFKSAIGLSEVPVGLLDLVTGGYAGKALKEGIGYDPKAARAILDEEYSPAQKAAFSNVRNAFNQGQDQGGIISGIAQGGIEAIKNPSTIGHTILESLPSMAAGSVLGKGALGAIGGRMAAPAAEAIATGIGEGGVTAASAAEQIRQESPTGTLSIPQIDAAVASGVGTGLLGAAGRRTADFLGTGDVDSMLLRGTRELGEQAASKERGVIGRTLTGALNEGILEELPQSLQEQMWQNLALGKPISEGMAEAGGMGMLSGMGMGAGGGILSKGPIKPQEAAIAPVTADNDTTDDLLNGTPVDQQIIGGNISSGMQELNGRIMRPEPVIQPNLFTPESVAATMPQAPQTDLYGNPYTAQSGVQQEAPQVDPIVQQAEQKYQQTLTTLKGQGPAAVVKTYNDLKKEEEASKLIHPTDNQEVYDTKKQTQVINDYVRKKLEADYAAQIPAIQKEVQKRGGQARLGSVQQPSLFETGTKGIEYTQPIEQTQAQQAVQDQKAAEDLAKRQEKGMFEEADLFEEPTALVEESAAEPVVEEPAAEVEPAATEKKKTGGRKKKVAPAAITSESSLSDILGTAEKRGPVEEQPTQHSEQDMNDVMDVVHKLTGGKAQFEYVDGNMVREDKAGNRVEIKGESVGHIVRIVKTAKDIKGIARHETIHALKNMGLFTKQEWAVLETKAKGWIKQFGIDKTYSHLNKEQQLNEAIAHAFENPAVKQDTFLKRIKDFFEAVWNKVRGRGFQTAEKVFNKIESGEIGEREWDGTITDSFSRPAIGKWRDAATLNKTISDQLDKIVEAVKKARKKEPISYNEKIQSIDGKQTLSFKQVADMDFKTFVNSYEKDYTKETMKAFVDAFKAGELVPISESEGYLRGFKALYNYTNLLNDFVGKFENASEQATLKTPIKIKGFGVIKSVADLRSYVKAINTARSAVETTFKDGNFDGMLGHLDTLEKHGFSPRSFYNREAIIKAFTFKHLGSVSEVLLPEWLMYTDTNMYKNRDLHKEAWSNAVKMLHGFNADGTEMSKASIEDHVHKNPLIKQVVNMIAGKMSSEVISLEDLGSKERNMAAMTILRQLQNINAVQFSNPYGDTLRGSNLTPDEALVITKESNLENILDYISELAVDEELTTVDVDKKGSEDIGVDYSYEQGIFSEDEQLADNEVAGTRLQGIDPFGTKNRYVLAIAPNAIEHIITEGKRNLRGMKTQFADLVNTYRADGDKDALIKGYIDLLINQPKSEIDFNAQSTRRRRVNTVLAPVSHAFALNHMTRRLYLDSVTSRNKGDVMRRDNQLTKAAQAGALHAKMYDIWPVYMPESNYLEQIYNHITDKAPLSVLTYGEISDVILPQETLDRITNDMHRVLFDDNAREYRKLVGEIQENQVVHGDNKKGSDRFDFHSHEHVSSKISKLLAIYSNTSNTRAKNILDTYLARLEKGFGFYESEDNKGDIEKVNKYIQDAIKNKDWSITKQGQLTKLLKGVSALDIPLSKRSMYTPMANFDLGSLISGYGDLSLKEKEHIKTTVVPKMVQIVSGMVGYPVNFNIRETGKGNNKVDMYLSGNPYEVSKQEYRVGVWAKAFSDKSYDRDFVEKLHKDAAMSATAIQKIANAFIATEDVNHSETLEDIVLQKIAQTTDGITGREEDTKAAISQVKSELHAIPNNVDLRDYVLDKLSTYKNIRIGSYTTTYKQQIFEDLIIPPYIKVQELRDAYLDNAINNRTIAKTADQRTKNRAQIFQRLSQVTRNAAGPAQPYKTFQRFTEGTTFERADKSFDKSDEQRLIDRILNNIGDEIFDNFTKEEIQSNLELTSNFINVIKETIGGFTIPKDILSYNNLTGDFDFTQLDSFEERSQAYEKGIQERAEQMEEDIAYKEKIEKLVLNALRAEANYLHGYKSSHAFSAEEQAKSANKLFKNSVTNEVVQVLGTFTTGAKRFVRIKDAAAINGIVRNIEQSVFEKNYKGVSLTEKNQENYNKQVQNLTYMEAISNLSDKARNILNDYFFNGDLADVIKYTDEALKELDVELKDMRDAGKSKADIDTKEKVRKAAIMSKYTKFSFSKEDLAKAYNMKHGIGTNMTAEEIKASLGKLGQNKISGIKESYLSPQVAAEFKIALQELEDAGFLTTSVPTNVTVKGGTKVENRFTYGNKFMPTQKLFKYILDQNNTKRLLEQTQASIATATIENLQGYVDSEGKFKNLIGDAAKNLGITKENAVMIGKWLRNLVATPFFTGQRHREFLPLAITSSLTRKISDWHKSNVAQHILPILNRMKKLDAEAYQKLHNLIEYADAMNKEVSFAEAQQKTGVDKASYDMFKELQNKISETMPAAIAESASAAYAGKYEGLFKDVGIRKAIYDNIGVHFGSLTEEQVKQIATDTMPASIAASPKWSKKYIKDMVGYNDFLSQTKQRIGEVKNWMPRIRRIGKYSVSIKNSDNALVGMAYFDDLKEAEAWKAKAIAKDPSIVKYRILAGDLTGQIDATDSSAMSLFSTMDSKTEFSDIQQAFDGDMAHALNHPAFGQGTLTDGDAGGASLQRRTKNLIFGYDNTDFYSNYVVALERMAMSFSRLEYGMTQLGNMEKIREQAKDKPELNQYIPEFMDHIQHDLKRSTGADQIASRFKQISVVYYMGLRIVPMLVNSLQPFTSSAPELAYLYGKKNFAANQIKATKDIAKFVALAAADLRDSKIMREDKSPVGKAIYAALKVTFGEPKGVGDRLSPEHKRAVEEFSRAGILAGMHNEQSFANELDDTYFQRNKEAGMSKLVDNMLKGFQLTEMINREGTFLASFDHFYKESNGNYDESFAKAQEFVLGTQYLTNKFNMPLGFKQFGAAGTAAYSLMSFPFNMINQLVKHSTNAAKGDYDSLKVVAGMVMVLFALGGAKGLPFGDLFEWFWNTFVSDTGDYDTDMRSMMKNWDAPDFAQNILMYGVPTLAGVSISGNISMKTPLIGGMLEGKNPTESIFGASGSMLRRPYDALEYAKRSDWFGTLEKLTPEVVGAPIRAGKEFFDDKRSKTGAKVFYKGQPVNTDAGTFAASAIGLQPISKVERSEGQQAERGVIDKFKRMAESAQREFRLTGDVSAIQQFNQARLKAGPAVARLVAPIKPAKDKPDVKKTTFERLRGN